MSTDVVVDALAVYRLTRLATKDTLAEQPRRAVVQWAYRRVGDELPIDEGETVAAAVEVATSVDPLGVPKLATLVTCRWCTSVWVAAGVVAARRYAPRLWGPVASLLAGSAVGTLLAGLEAD